MVSTMKEHFDVTQARKALELATDEGDSNKMAAAHQRLLEALARAQYDQKEKTARVGW